MTREMLIKEELKKRNMTQAEFAQKLKLRPSVLNQYIKNKFESKNIKAQIEEILNIEL
jgi:transcriptional regulator with XRE-family HTH domain